MAKTTKRAPATKKTAEKAVKSSPKKPEKAEATPVKKIEKPAASAPKGESKSPAPSKAAKAPTEAPAKSSRADLRSSILARRNKAGVKPIAFSLDEVKEIAKVVAPKLEAATEKAAVKAPSKLSKQAELAKVAKPATPNHIKAASLADILGFNPKKAAKPEVTEEVPEKYRRYYKLLLDLRSHLTGQIDLHSEDTLKRSSKDDAGDLSSYGQHMADAGTDTFDRDFALSLVSSEQEALSEIEAAIQRIRAGTYGICEVSGEPISKERLMAVPFTRYSAGAQKDIEKNRMRSRTQAGLFGEMGEEGGGKIMDEDSGGDE